MKKIAFLFLFCCELLQPARAQFPLHPDSLFQFIRSQSVHRGQVDWKLVEERFHACLAKALQTRDTMNCFVGILEIMDDVHSQLFLDGQFFGNYPVFDDSTRLRLLPLVNQSNAETNRVTIAMANRSTAYLRLPSITVGDQASIESLAQQIRDSLNRLLSKKPKGLIIDLRLNGGGNIYPMLSGLGPLLGDGEVGFETDYQGQRQRTWEIRGGNFVIGGYQSTHLAAGKPNPGASHLPVAILIGPATRSSGTMVGIAFRHRPYTKLIGEATAAGYTTSNGYFQITPRLMMNLAAGFVADRKGQLYRKNLEPEIQVNLADDFTNLQMDPKIRRAIDWLQKQYRP